MNLTRKAVAECIGTFILVFFACGTAIVTRANIVATALSFGLVLVAMAYTIGTISGCHLNPAVSIGKFFAKKMTLIELGVYVLAQLIGAAAGAAALYGILKGADYTFGAGGAIWATNGVVAGASAVNYVVSFILEVILTFVFVYTVLCVTNRQDHSKIAGLITGFTLTLVHLLGIGLTGTSVNPARSFGPAIMSYIFGGGTTALIQLWVFIAAPILGGILAACAFKCINVKFEKTEKAAK